jgi:hypothetical protein
LFHLPPRDGDSGGIGASRRCRRRLSVRHTPRRWQAADALAADALAADALAADALLAETQASGFPAATNGYVHARNSFDMRLDVKGVSKAAGASVIQWYCNGGTNQEWFLTRGTV